MFIIDPPATAGGTDLLQVRLLTFEAKPFLIFNAPGLSHAPTLG